MARAVASACLGILLAVFCPLAAAGPNDNGPPPPGMSAAVINAYRPVLGYKEDRTAAEQKLDSTLLFALRTIEGGLVSRANASPPFVSEFIDKHVNAVDETLFVVIRTEAVNELAAALALFGAREISEFPMFETITAIVPIAALLDIAARSDVRFIGPRDEARTNRSSGASDVREGIKQRLLGPSPKVGTLTWQGVVAHQAINAHNAGIVGLGAKVCVLSDGANSVPLRIASGDLPASILPLSGQAGSGDEGTAMLEIVHDMAPGASLFFATSKPSDVQFATNILNLYSVFGCDVMVDDVVYVNEGAFQDGPIAQAVNLVTASGVTFFSSAANYGNQSDGTSGTFEGDFVSSGAALPPAIAAFEGSSTFPSHAFGALPYTTLTKPTSLITLKWSDPLGASTNDYDLFVTDSTGGTVFAGSNRTQSGTQDPYESVQCNSCSFPAGARIYVVKYFGATRAIRLSTYEGGISNGTAGSTVGHNAAASVLTVAAVNLATAAGGAFVGGATNPIETFSSDGPRKLFYYPNGTAITPGNFLFGTGGGITLNKVDLAAGDRGSTTTPGFQSFPGTSAAAPTAAGIAALVKSAKHSATRQEITNALLTSALDIEAAGWDRDSGFGIVMAPPALRAVLSPLTVSKAFVPSLISAGGSSVLTISVSNSNATDLQGVAFTDTYPFPLVNASVPNATISGTGCSASGSFIAGNNAFAISTSTVPAGMTCVFRVSVTSNSTGAFFDPSGALTTPIALNTPAAVATLTVAGPPSPPTGASASAGNAQISVTFIASANNGGLTITGYTVACVPAAGGAPIVVSGAASPIVVSGLVNGLAYLCTVTASNAAGTSVPSTPSNTVTPNKASQTITFDVLPNRSYSGTPLTISATASSSLTVSFSSLTTQVCTVSGSSVTLVSLGTCTIAVDQAGDLNFLPALQVTQSFLVTGIFRAYLSQSGSDANPCTLQLPCRLLPAALAGVNDGGEIWMLNSANFNIGVVNIAKSVTILAVPGALGSVVANNGDAIRMSAHGIEVTLRNLVILNLSGAGNTGVQFNQGSQLTIEGCEIYGVGTGVSVGASGGVLAVKDTTIRDNAAAGVHLQAVILATLERVELINNATYGLLAQSGARVTVSGSAILGSATGALVAAISGAKTELTLSETDISGNGTAVGVTANAGGDTAHVVLDDVTITHNTAGVAISGAGTKVVFTRENNVLRFNSTDITGGALTPLGAQ